MPDIEFIFPSLDGAPDENTPQEAADYISEVETTEEPSPEQLLSVLIDSRYVSLDNNNIDISQFPALRNALGLASTESIDSVLSAGNNDAQSDENDDNLPLLELPKEEPIPSIFEGIGRSDWASFERELLIAEAHETADDTAQQAFDSEESPQNDESKVEDEEEIDTEYLLDFIDDIEFAGMDAEPLSPVKIIQTSSDPYNSSFNANPYENEELDEFDMNYQFVFEQK